MSTLICSDILQFQEQLKQMRDLDDKIIYALNLSLPTESIKARSAINPESSCKELYGRLKQGYDLRGEKIRECIMVTAESVKKLKVEREKNLDSNIDKIFKTEQRKLRILKQEQQVEDIVKERTLKTFNERCRQFFHMDSF